MFFVNCAFCHVGIEIPATATGPDCTAFGNVGFYPECDESFLFDGREIIEEKQPETAV